MIDKHLLESSHEAPLTDEDRRMLENKLAKRDRGYKSLKSAIEQRVDELAEGAIKGGPGSGRYPKGSSDNEASNTDKPGIKKFRKEIDNVLKEGFSHKETFGRGGKDIAEFRHDDKGTITVTRDVHSGEVKV